MTVEELEAKIVALEKEREQLTKKVEGLESLSGKRGTELGEIREKFKESEALATSIKDLTEKLDSATKEIESLKSIKPTLKDTQPPPPAESDAEKAEKLEKQLTDEEKKLVEGYLEKNPEVRDEFIKSDSVRVALLEEVKAGNGKVAPDSIWRVKPKPSGDDSVKKIRSALKEYMSKGLPPDTRGGDFGRSQREPTLRKPLV